MNKLTLFFLITCALSSQAQVNDAGLWTSINLDKKFTPKFTLSLNNELRMNENISEAGTAFSEFAVEYKINRYFSTSAAYRFIVKRRVDDFYSRRHRLQLNLSGKYKPGKLSIGLRLRYQSQYSNVYSSTDGKVSANYLRSKLTLKYGMGKKYSPFISGESFFHVNVPFPVKFDDYRVAAGITYEFNKKCDIDLFYLIDREINKSDPLTSYVSGIAFNYSF